MKAEGPEARLVPAGQQLGADVPPGRMRLGFHPAATVRCNSRLIIGQTLDISGYRMLKVSSNYLKSLARPTGIEPVFPP